MDREVELWLECLEEKEGPRRFFARFLREVVAKHPRLQELGPTGLLEFQANARTREDRFLIGDEVRRWVNQMTLTAGSKKTRYGQINSFFLHRNKEGLPSDPGFHWTNSVAPVDGYLPFDELRGIVTSSNLMYRAVFLMKVQGLLDNAGVIYISNHHATKVIDAIKRDVGVFRLSLPPRKMNPKPYFTMLSSKSDFADAFRSYMRLTTYEIHARLFWTQSTKPSEKDGSLIVNRPLKTHNIQYYFHQRAVKLGIIKPHTPKCEECGDATVWRRRMYQGKKMVCYVCVNKKCQAVKFACDMGREWRHELSRARYGKHPHETRDLMSSRWANSGADRVVREGIMGHRLDPNNYEKFKYQPGFAEKEYRKALPWLNIVSTDPTKVDRTEVDEELDVLRRRVLEMERERQQVREQLQRIEDELKRAK